MGAKDAPARLGKANMTSRAIAAFGHSSHDQPEPVSVPLHWDQHRPKVPTPNTVPQVTIPVYLGAFFFDAPRQPKNKARVFLRSHRARLRGNVTGRDVQTPNFPSSLSVRVHRRTRTFGVTSGFRHKELAYSGRLCLSPSVVLSRKSSAHQRANVQASMAHQTHRWNVLIIFGSPNSSWPEHLSLDSALNRSSRLVSCVASSLCLVAWGPVWPLPGRHPYHLSRRPRNPCSSPLSDQSRPGKVILHSSFKCFQAVCDLPARCAFFYCSNKSGLEALGAASPANTLVHIPSSLSDETGVS
ncbi:uncharacterized protein BDZ83DRAFT_86593 [Colletotrichum acutatum]|uniref:Uncharacterized protein n=1 Tax=Glomerella acutata TaxID=27357 RepID=A0AAD8XK90_GLOAC|nr:uncharacterized protein BDZ83DRAFT_86593 [Colletotrichum acutatum]KAK1728907.1 hypothetical protein BDZ83DRAFT_86593 [Colletotrichum acutatum]